MSVNSLLAKPVVSAALSAVALPLAMGAEEFYFGGKSYPLWLVAGLIGGASSFASEAAHDFILPHIPHGSARVMRFESIALALGAGGSSFVLASKLLNSSLNFEEAKQMFLVGSAVEVASSYITTNLVGTGTI